jgi:adenylate cyclase
MGSNQRFDYTCLGDGVNLASRLEGQSKPYGVKIVLGTKTAEYVKDEYFVLELDCIAVKGKKEGVNIFTVLDDKNMTGTWHTSKIHHNRMLELYRSKEFERAIGMCETLIGCFDGEMDHYYEAWMDRCREMAKMKLPANWDGVHRANSK